MKKFILSILILFIICFTCIIKTKAEPSIQSSFIGLNEKAIDKNGNQMKDGYGKFVKDSISKEMCFEYLDGTVVRIDHTELPEYLRKNYVLTDIKCMCIQQGFWFIKNSSFVEAYDIVGNELPNCVFKIVASFVEPNTNREIYGIECFPTIYNFDVGEFVIDTTKTYYDALIYKDTVPEYINFENQTEHIYYSVLFGCYDKVNIKENYVNTIINGRVFMTSEGIDFINVYDNRLYCYYNFDFDHDKILKFSYTINYQIYNVTLNLFGKKWGYYSEVESYSNTIEFGDTYVNSENSIWNIFTKKYVNTKNELGIERGDFVIDGKSYNYKIYLGLWHSDVSGDEGGMLIADDGICVNELYYEYQGLVFHYLNFDVEHENDYDKPYKPNNSGCDAFDGCNEKIIPVCIGIIVVIILYFLYKFYVVKEVISNSQKNKKK